MPDRVRITDVAPRDGLQNEPGVIDTDRKVRLIELLAASGVDEIEATSFVSPKWVPQLADASEVMEAVRASMTVAREGAAEPSPSGRGQGEGDRSGPPLPSGEGRGEGSEKRRYHKRESTAVGHAGRLRREMTDPERRLWSRLRGDQLRGVRFRRQHTIGRYIIDFYCPAARVAIELDGRSHKGEAAAVHDAARESWLRSQDIEIVRFTNDQVMQDIEAVLRSIDHKVQARLSRDPSPPSPLPEGEGGSAPAISVLVPNRKGFDRARVFHSPDWPLKIAVFTAASETFSQRNTNASIAETIERFRAFVPDALAEGMRVRLYISCAVACPYEGAIDPSAVREVADDLLGLAAPEAIERGDVELDLGDTIGAAAPEDIERLLSVFTAAERERLVIHLHDTHGRAPSCVKRALDLGVRSFDGSAGGLGGCPYAGTKEKPAPGNISTDTLVRTVHGAGFTTGVDLDTLAEASAYAQGLLGEARGPGA